MNGAQARKIALKDGDPDMVPLVHGAMHAKNENPIVCLHLAVAEGGASYW